MEIALLAAVIVAFLAGLLGLYLLRALWALRSTVDRDRARVAQSVRHLRTALDTAFGKIDDQAGQLTAIGAELAAVGETSQNGQRSISEYIARLKVIDAELAMVRELSQAARRTADQALEAAVGPATVRPPSGGAATAPPVSPTTREAVILPFPKNTEEVPQPEPIEDPPSGESERVRTLEDVIRLIAPTLPADSSDAKLKAIAAMFREDPKADMDTDSGPLWCEIINHFLQTNPRVPIPEIAEEYNRRVAKILGPPGGDNGEPG